MPKTIDQLILNSPYQEPAEYWSYNRERREFIRKPGRRPAGYVRASESSKSFDDPGEFIELPLVNKIRPRVKAWREADYPGATGITKRLLKHWWDAEQRESNRRLFFCQLEAIETLIWLVEAPASERVGIEIPGDGGEFARLCAKMATGAGKTIAMAMLIAWQVLNKVTYPQDKRFSKNILVIAPGLTVKNRLEVLVPGRPGNYYSEFRLVPPGLEDKLRQGQTCRVLVHNWHKLDWETEEQIRKKRSVDKRGPKSDEAYVREVLGEMASAQNIVVINDEAHHAWRVPPKVRIPGVSREELEEATKWIGGLDRIHRARGILTCFDFTATPFAPTGRKSGEETLFGWIVSDFGLNDAIESGLVKTPRVVIRDDGKLTSEYKSRFYHIYMDPEVKSDLNRKAEPHTPLPDLVVNGYYFLGKDWLETAKKWQEAGLKTPPVMITVANRTETAARVQHAFAKGKIHIEELSQPDKILHIDSKVLEKAEAREEPIEIEYAEAENKDENGENGNGQRPKLSKKDYAELLRRTVDTIGREGQLGEQIQKVISVGMLSEGWDAKTVTHIMGLRAFTSQLLCEQVVGRGLRRMSYEVDEKTGLFKPEYVNIFGVPFTFLPHEGGADEPPPPPPPPKTRIEPLPERRAAYEITWPNVIRVDHEYRPQLTLDPLKTKPLVLDAYDTAMLAELAPVIDGKPDVTRLTEISLEELGRKFRMQKIIFATASDLYDQMKPTWKGSREYLLAQLIRLVERFIESGNIQVHPPLFHEDDLRRRIVITLNMSKVVQHMWEAIRFENSLALEPVFDTEKPVRSTGDMLPWYTGKPCEHTKRSHINMCVFDSTWEASEAFELDRNPNVAAWVKNDHLGFEITYSYKGVIRKFRPDYLVRLTSGKMLVLEVKGQDTQEQQTKREFLDEWIRAVNGDGGFGTWVAAVSRHPGDIHEVLVKHNSG
ncbi:MAG: DEAD/DEAH box helicase family protein [Acidobacteriia bacterium]|jgi:type III restriction enzyme|nr:DEAD/DEAH box helicase family protein [Terriglobia bacterium]